MSELRAWHWGLAFLLAIALHLGVYLSLLAEPAIPQHGRGGGELEGLGQRGESRPGLRVSLGRPEAVPEPSPNAAPPAVRAAPAAPPEAPPEASEAPAEAVEEPPVETSEASVEAVEEPPQEEPPQEEPPTEEPPTAQAPDQPGTPEAFEPTPEITSPPPREQQQVAKLTPPLPPRKPHPPVPKPEFGLVEQRLPVEGPAAETPPAPQQQSASAAQPTQNTEAQNTEAQTTEAQNTEAQNAGSQISELVQSAQEGRLGDASSRTGGEVRTLNYKERVLLWLKRHGSYPRDSYRYRHEGVVLLEFEIDRGGRVLYYHVAKSSGYHLLDQEVKQMMQRASPVPPIPTELAQDRMHFTIPVRFIYG